MSEARHAKCDGGVRLWTERPDRALEAGKRLLLIVQLPPAKLPPMATPDISVDLTAEELGAWRGLLRVHTALVKALDAELAAAHDLPLSSYEVLITLESAPGRKRRMAELADSVLLSRSGMTRLVDRLADNGLLERDLCTDDGRGCYAVLTDKGAEVLATARPTHLDGVRERFLRHFSSDELVMLAEMWNRVLPGAAATPE
jgi:DNA-binding MarR family transcriptional regulator